jgi:hypothetical protein
MTSVWPEAESDCLGAHARTSIDTAAKGERKRRALSRYRTRPSLQRFVRDFDQQKRKIASPVVIKLVHEISPVLNSVNQTGSAKELFPRSVSTSEIKTTGGWIR